MYGTHPTQPLALTTTTIYLNLVLTQVVGNSELGLRFLAVAKNKLVPLQDCSFARAQAHL